MNFRRITVFLFTKNVNCSNAAWIVLTVFFARNGIKTIGNGRIFVALYIKKNNDIIETVLVHLTKTVSASHFLNLENAENEFLRNAEKRTFQINVKKIVSE